VHRTWLKFNRLVDKGKTACNLTFQATEVVRNQNGLHYTMTSPLKSRMWLIMQVNVLYVLPAWLGRVASHPLVRTHPDRSSLTLIVYGTPHVPFKYKRRIRSAGFRDVVYGKKTVVSFHTDCVFWRRRVFFFTVGAKWHVNAVRLCTSWQSGNETSRRPQWVYTEYIYLLQICSGNGRSKRYTERDENVKRRFHTSFTQWSLLDECTTSA